MTAVAERFFSKIDKTAKCWLWTSCIDPKGYGQFTVANHTRRAHRISWELHYGAIPPSYCILHACDVRHCVNPAHLFLGTPRDNMQDCKAKGRLATGDRHGFKLHPERLARGESNGAAKLTMRKVQEIRRLYAIGSYTKKKLGERFGVCGTTISHIIWFVTWREER